MELGNNPQGELYDLSSDPYEQHNVIKEHPEIAKRLAGDLQNIVERRE